MKKKKRAKALLALVFVLAVFFGAVVSSSAVEVVGQIPALVTDSLPESLENISSEYDRNAPAYSFVIDTYAIYYLLYIDQTDVLEFDYQFYDYLVQWTDDNQNFIRTLNLDFIPDTPYSGSVSVSYPSSVGSSGMNYSSIDIIEDEKPDYRYIIIPFSEFGDFYATSVMTTVLDFSIQWTGDSFTTSYTGAPLSIYNNVQFNSTMEYAEQRYREGQQDATEIGEGGARLITAVVEAPVNVFTHMLNFEILGVNVLGLVVALLSFGLVFAILKRVL